jgi:hypothetical protein
MFEYTITIPSGRKVYFQIRGNNSIHCSVSINSPSASEMYYLLLQRKNSFFIARSMTGQSELKFSAREPLAVVVHPLRKRRKVSIKLLELFDDFRRKRGSLWPEIKTESGVHIREITPGRFMPNAYSRSERFLFHRLRLTRSNNDGFPCAEHDCSNVLSGNVLHDLLVSAGESRQPEFVFGCDAVQFSPENRYFAQCFAEELFGNPMTGDGPAWDFMRRNPGIGMVYWSGEAEGRSKKYHDRALRRLASVLDIDIPSLAMSMSLPPLFLVRVQALSWVSASNVVSSDIESGLRDAHALRSMLPALIQKAGYTIGPMPDLKDVEKIGKPVELAKWFSGCLPVNIAGRDICLFVGLLNAQNCFSEHALVYMQALRKQGFFVYALGVSLSDPELAQDPGRMYSDAFAARANDGHDFGLWAAAFKRTPEVWLANSVLLANDSMVPSTIGFDDLFSKIKNSTFDVTGLTESEIGFSHIQSYFIHMKRTALQTPEVKMFWDAVLSWKDKNRIIALYEIGMTPKFTAAGLQCGVVFDVGKYRAASKSNATIHGWRELIADGFPFIKTQVLREALDSSAALRTLDFLEENGFSREAITREFQNNGRT